MRLSGMMLVVLAAVVGISGCSVDPPMGGGSDLASPKLAIPGALTSSTSRAVSVPDANGVFEPFRASLDVAAEVLASVYGIIDKINDTEVPDSYSQTQSDGKKLVITLDDSRTYPKRIAYYKDATVVNPYLIIQYIKGSVKGQIFYFDDLAPVPKIAVGTLAAIKVDYDETLAAPVLEISATLRSGTATETHPKTLHYKGVYKTGGTEVSGGVGYRYVVDIDGTATNDNPDSYSGDHAYMFKAVASADGTKSRVELFFPPASATSVDTAADSVDASYLSIVRKWIEKNASIQTTLTNLNPKIRYDNDSNLKADLDAWKAAYPNDSSLDALLFILNLTNPIAYSSSGYVANGTATVLASGEYSAAVLGDPSTIAFGKSPKDVFEISVAQP